MRAALFLSLVLLPLRAWAVFDVFLEVTPVGAPALGGGVSEPLYSGWIAVAGFESSIFRVPVTIPVVGDEAAFREFTLVKTADRATGQIFAALTAPTELTTVKMVRAELPHLHRTRAGRAVHLFEKRRVGGRWDDEHNGGRPGGSVFLPRGDAVE